VLVILWDHPLQDQVHLAKLFISLPKYLLGVDNWNLDPSLFKLFNLVSFQDL
jgi:hypothetical protein